MAESCPLAGEHFDEVSWLYPLRIPLEPKVHRLDETSDAVAVVTLFNRNQFVSVIGNQELESSCKAYPGSFLFCVGELEKKIKGDMVFWNLRPRGWKLYPVHECIETGQEKGIKRKKGNNGDK